MPRPIRMIISFAMVLSKGAPGIRLVRGELSRGDESATTLRNPMRPAISGAPGPSTGGADTAFLAGRLPFHAIQDAAIFGESVRWLERVMALWRQAWIRELLRGLLLGVIVRRRRLDCRLGPPVADADGTTLHWRNLEFAAGVPAGRSIKLHFEANLFAPHCRPLLRTRLRGGGLDRALPGPLFGANFWI